MTFKTQAFIKLKQVKQEAFSGMISPMLLSGEKIMSTYQGIRDGVVFTDKRIFVINVQGITGKKKDFTSLPYSKIQSFSVETAGVFDLDSELVLWFSGLGKVKLEFTSDCNVTEICRMIGEKVL